METDKNDPTDKAAALSDLADARGLRHLLELDAKAFNAAVTAAAELSQRTERPLELAVEPAHTCRFPNRGPRNG